MEDARLCINFIAHFLYRTKVKRLNFRFHNLMDLAVFFMPKNKMRGMRTMSKVFLYGTKLQEMEQLMLLVPNFAPRMKGMVVVGKRMLNENEEFKKCIYCDNYTKGGCKENQCAHLMERAAFGQIKYGALLKDSFGDFHHYNLILKRMYLVQLLLRQVNCKNHILI